MRQIGLVGGISWPSTLEYYRILNQLTARRLGSDHSAKLTLVNLDVGEIYAMMAREDEEQIYQTVLGAAKTLKAAGVEVVILCANGVHRFYERLTAELGLPMVHIAEATAAAVARAGLKKVGLLGVKKTMEGTFYSERMKRYGVEVIVPSAQDRDYIDRSIFEELIRDQFTESTRQRYLSIMEDLVKEGADGIVLGCTEIPLLIKPSDTSIRLFSTTDLHCEAVMEFAFSGS